MEVSDEEIAAYRKQREQMDKGVSEEEAPGSIINEIINLQTTIDETKAKLK